MSYPSYVRYGDVYSHLFDVLKVCTRYKIFSKYPTGQQNFIIDNPYFCLIYMSNVRQTVRLHSIFTLISYNKSRSEAYKMMDELLTYVSRFKGNKYIAKIDIENDIITGNDPDFKYNMATVNLMALFKPLE